MAAIPPDLRERVLAALKTVLDPEMHVDLVTAGMVKEVALEGGVLRLGIELTTPACPLKDVIERDVRAAVGKVPGVPPIEIVFTSRVRTAPAFGGTAAIPGVRNVVAVASGKGGVGKSTVATNLATALAATGARTGILDCDIHGPSVAKMFGLASVQPQARGKRIIPFEVGIAPGCSLKVMSMAFFLEEDQPVVWRGPMLHKALQQFLHDVEWGELDYLVLDLPPGTGDVQLSLAQLVPMTGALVVTTPQDVALLDVRKAIAMFRKVQVPILGIVENMAAFQCPSCESVHPIFGEGGGEALAKEMQLPFLGSVPLAPSVRVAGDAGRPIVATASASASAEALRAVARKLAGEVSRRAGAAGYALELPVVGAG
jgi:ATP-binding protein involved in chromosome partitioning